MKVGLIGEKLGHSFSKIIHEQIEDYTYDLMPLSREEFPLYMEKKNFDAINVTIPYKEVVIPYCDIIDEKAKEIGAVNAIKNVNGKLYATNTDFDGLKWMIENHLDIKNKIVAICGSGGTSKTAYAVCKTIGVKEIVRVARGNKGENYINYSELQNRKDIEIIINTTSVGMMPDMMSSIVNLDDFPLCEGVIDVVYNPLLTSLCYQAKVKNIPYICGLEMLVGQAVSAIEFFTGKKIERNVIKSITHTLHRDKQNIVFVDLSDFEKESLAKPLANLFHMNYKEVDTSKDFIYDEIAKINHSIICCSFGAAKEASHLQALSLNGLIVETNEYLKQELAHMIEKYNANQREHVTLDEFMEVLYENTCD